MKPVKFLEHVKIYPDTKIEILTPEGGKYFRNLREAVECLQRYQPELAAREAARTATGYTWPGIYLRTVRESCLPYEVEKTLRYRIKGATYMDFLGKYSEKVSIKDYYLSPKVDEVYGVTFYITESNGISNVGPGFWFDFGLIYGDYPQYETGQRVLDKDHNRVIYINRHFEKSKLEDEMRVEGGCVLVGYYGESKYPPDPEERWLPAEDVLSGYLPAGALRLC